MPDFAFGGLTHRPFFEVRFHDAKNGALRSRFFCAATARQAGPAGPDQAWGGGRTVLEMGEAHPAAHTQHASRRLDQATWGSAVVEEARTDALPTAGLAARPKDNVRPGPAMGHAAPKLRAWAVKARALRRPGAQAQQRRGTEMPMAEARTGLGRTDVKTPRCPSPAAAQPGLPSSSGRPGPVLRTRPGWRGAAACPNGSWAAR